MSSVWVVRSKLREGGKPIAYKKEKRAAKEAALLVKQTGHGVTIEEVQLK